jgi:transcriptional regulator with XRE-family HTH domain
MVDINDTVGKRIRSLRKSKGMTQEALAFESNIDYSYINEIEAGKRNPSVKRLNNIARALKVSIKDLFE